MSTKGFKENVKGRKNDCTSSSTLLSHSASTQLLDEQFDSIHVKGDAGTSCRLPKRCSNTQMSSKAELTWYGNRVSLPHILDEFLAFVDSS